MRAVALSILTLFLCMSVPAFAKQACHFKSDNVQVIAIKPGQTTVKVKLKANPTTGYSWFLTRYNARLVQPVSAVYAAPANKKLVGAPGSVTWTFKLLPHATQVPQISTIMMRYLRPWDKDRGELKVLRLVMTPAN